MKKFIYSFIGIMSFFIFMAIFTNTVKAAEFPSLTYCTHVQEEGWQDYVGERKMSGTSGKSYRLEAIKIKLNTPKTLKGNIEYSVHVQEEGWQDFVNSDEMAGTSGKSYRLEGIKINLTGKITEKYDIYYRVHVQDIGWQEWKKNGELAGTTGKSLRLEAIEIKLKLKDEFIIQGIDVSSHNKEIDWEQVKEDGIEFAMIRVGFRGYGVSDDGVDGKLVKDAYFDTYIKGALKNDIPVGVYFFSQAITEEEAIEEAELTLEAIEDYKIKYPVVIDTEHANSAHTGRADSLTIEERTKIVKTFCKTIEKAGYTPMVYTGRNFAYNNLDMEELEDYDFWVAHYTGATQDDPLNATTDYKGSYVMWQYTSKGSVLGIEGNVDRNVWYLF